MFAVFISGGDIDQFGNQLAVLPGFDPVYRGAVQIEGHGIFRNSNLFGFGRKLHHDVGVHAGNQLGLRIGNGSLNLQHAGILNNFTNAILGLEPQAVDGREGIRGVELMNAMELSGWNGGEEIALPVDEERYLAELNAHRAVSRLKTGGNKPVVDTTGTFGPS